MNKPVPAPILDRISRFKKEIGCAHSTMLSCEFDLAALRIDSNADGW